MRSRKIALLLFSITLLFTITAFQSSTVLHRTVAHSPQAAPDDGLKPEGMAGTQVVLRAAGFDFDNFIPPPIVSGGLDQNSRAAIFNVTYTGFTPQAEAAFQHAVDIWETLITSSVTIEVDATWTNLGGSTLGSAGPVGFWRNFSGAPAPNTWYPVAMANSLNGSDLDAVGADIVAQFNSNFTWYLGTDGNAGPGEYDLVTVVMHELGHGLGFTGSGAYDDGTGSPECVGVADQGCVTRLGDPRTYDNFVEDSSGLSVLGYPTPSAALGALFTSGNLFWNSPRAVLINGGPPELYAPATWAQGSSYSHLDETAFPPANPHSLMTPQLASMEAIHDPGQITLCMFEDMGWDAACAAPTAAVWTGAAGTNWSDNGNWDIGVAPTSVVDVTIPAAGVFPTVDTNTTIGGLTVASGAQINMSANTLSLVGDLAVAGTFNGTGGTVTMVGDGAQAIDIAAGQLFNLRVGDGTTSQTVNLNSNVTVAGDLTLESGVVLDANSATLTVGGAWQDNGGGTTFVADTSTVVLTGTAGADAAPFTTTSYASDAAGSWWRYSDPPPDVTWGFDSSATAPNSPYSGWVQRYPDPATGAPTQDANDTDISTQSFTLTAGVTYDVSLNYGASASSPAQNLEVRVGLGNTPAGLTNLVVDLPAITNTTWQRATDTFTPSTSGTYYIGFFTDVTDNDESVAFDDILIEATIVPALTFNNLTIAGDITFGADVEVQGNLIVQSGGSIDLQENGLMVEGTFSNSGDLSQTLDVPGSGTTRFLHITDAAGATDKYYGVDLTPAGSPLGSTTVVVSGNQAGCATGTDLGFVSRCVDVTPTTAADTTVRVWYTEAERGGLDASKLVLYHNGGTWAVAGSSSSGSEGGTTCAAGGGSACWVEAAGVTSFSPFAPGLDTSPTAVRLGGLNAVSPAGWEIGIWVLLSFAIGLTYAGWIKRRRPPA